MSLITVDHHDRVAVITLNDPKRRNALNLGLQVVQSPEAVEVKNLLIETRKRNPGAPLSEGAKVTKNASFKTLDQTVWMRLIMS